MICRAEPLHRELQESPRLAGAWTIYSHAGAEPGHRTNLLVFGFTVFPCGAPNVLTLSCKNCPPCGAHRGAVAAATERASEEAMCGRRAAVQFGAAQGGLAAGPAARRFLSACEGS